MTASLNLFSALALVPAMLGAQQGTGEHVTLALCGGGSLQIELPRDGAPPAEGNCSKGCHSGCSRKRIDRAQ